MNINNLPLASLDLVMVISPERFIFQYIFNEAA